MRDPAAANKYFDFEQIPITTKLAFFSPIPNARHWIQLPKNQMNSI